LLSHQLLEQASVLVASLSLATLLHGLGIKLLGAMPVLLGPFPPLGSSFPKVQRLPDSLLRA
jgi:hypothetical protein